jgi:polyhydroxyalkanoate synthesis regulator phasin
MLLERLLFRSGVLPYLRRQWRADQQQTESKAEGRVLRRLDELANRLQATSALADDVDALRQEVRLLP